jgi:hypothetical protein
MNAGRLQGLLQLLCKGAVRRQHFAKADERTHDRDVDLYRSLAA